MLDNIILLVIMTDATGKMANEMIDELTENFKTVMINLKPSTPNTRAVTATKRALEANKTTPINKYRNTRKVYQVVKRAVPHKRSDMEVEKTKPISFTKAISDFFPNEVTVTENVNSTSKEQFSIQQYIDTKYGDDGLEILVMWDNFTNTWIKKSMIDIHDLNAKRKIDNANQDYTRNIISHNRHMQEKSIQKTKENSAILYIRQSFTKNKDTKTGEAWETNSINAQVHNCIKFCEEMGWYIDDLLVQKSVSARHGKNFTKHWDAFIDENTDEVNNIVCNDYDRFSRHLQSAKEQLQILTSKNINLNIIENTTESFETKIKEAESYSDKRSNDSINAFKLKRLSKQAENYNKMLRAKQSRIVVKQNGELYYFNIKSVSPSKTDPTKLYLYLHKNKYSTLTKISFPNSDIVNFYL